MPIAVIAHRSKRFVGSLAVTPTSEESTTVGRVAFFPARSRFHPTDNN